MRCIATLLFLLLCGCDIKPSFLFDYKLLLNETFEGNHLNTSIWNTHLNVFGQKHSRYHNTQYLNFLSDSEVIVHDGLFLRNRRVDTFDHLTSIRHPYASGMVSSHDKFYFLYGYVEIRAKYPGGRGVWPCFWLMPQDGTWPPEFDIAEYYAGRKLMHIGLCYGNFPEILWDDTANNDVGFEQGFNNYGLLWEPGRAVWYQNGRIKHSIQGAHVPSKPMYIILSNGVSSRFGPSGAPTNQTKFPNVFEIKYLKVYQKQTLDASTKP